MPGPRIPELEKSLCGCTLRVGSKIIAAIFFSFSFLIFISSFGAVFWREYEDHNPNKEEMNRKYYEALLIEFALISALSGIHVTLSVLLWYGIEKHRSSYVLPWCILTTAFNAIFLIVTLTTFSIYFFTLGQIISLIIIGAVFYSILVVYSYFRQLRREKNSPTPFTNTE